MGSRTRWVAPCAASGSDTVNAAVTLAPAAEILGLEARTGPPRRAPARRHRMRPAEYPQSRQPTAGAGAPAPRTAGEALRTEGESLEFALGAEAAAGTGPAPGATAKAFEAAEARLALGVDLAAVECFALVVLAKDLVSGVDLGKARRSLRIVFVGVGMQFFRRRRKALLMSPALALRSTPNTS